MDEELECHLFTGITRAGDDHVDPGNFYLAELIAVQAQNLACIGGFNQLEQNLTALWTLQGNIRTHIRAFFRILQVAQDNLASWCAHPRTVWVNENLTFAHSIEPSPIFSFVGSIHHHEVSLRCAAVDQQVVNHIGLRVEEVGVE